MEEVEGFARKLRLHDKWKRHELPRIEILTKELPEADMPRLFKPFDAFVLPTRGEGFGMPMMEAMIMGIPTIATNWSGPTDFMTPENSFPIKVEKMVPVEAKTDSFLGKWAKPSLAHLKKVMRHVYTDREDARNKAKQARQDIIDHYSQERVAQMVVSRAAEIEQSVKRRRNEKTEEKTRRRAA